MASRKRRRKDQAPGWAWMLFGLSIGLAVALVVYLKSAPERPRPAAETDTAMDAAERASAAPPTAPPSASLPGSPSASREAQPAASTPASADAGTGTVRDSANAAEDETDFEFFHLLPESEVALPDTRTAAVGRAAAPREYTIQAGSFTTHEDADRLQARLALMNIEAAIQPAIVGNRIYYRVVIGPLSERAEINGVLRRLRDARIDSLPPQRVSD